VYLNEPAVHVNRDQGGTKRSDESMEIVLDEIVKSREDTLALGISGGDFVSLDPRSILTPSGFIKSRHLDDKASAGILLALAKEIADESLFQSVRSAYFSPPMKRLDTAHQAALQTTPWR